MASTEFQRLPGFRDFLPEDLAARERIFDAWRRVSRRYGFQEYDGPPLEPLELYTRKSGEEIVGQLYSFADKGGREVTLRPEMTPSLARILGERSRSMSKPIRWFSLPQLFRYERQQRGRLREHFQWNVDIVGEEDVLADAEVLAVAIDGLRELGLDHEDFHARVSDRRLLAAILGAVGVPEDRRIDAYGVIDKLEREDRERSRRRLVEEVGLSGDVADAALALFEDAAGGGLDPWRDRYGEREEVGRALERLDAYVGALEAMGLGAYVSPDPTIVRGLAYYTGIVFELFDRKGELRAICGGGRYDRLLELVGGEPLPAVGFGMGDVVLGELLKVRDLVPPWEHGIDFFVVVIVDDLREIALSVAHALRERGHSVAYALRGQSVRKQFSQAGQEGAREVVVLGPSEVERGVAVVREMRSGAEREVSLAGLREGRVDRREEA
ncbi:MAG: histidine--tRNA ligase [Gemmatimonadota bacterium]|jgi:histidyl-tRNA synthetase